MKRLFIFLVATVAIVVAVLIGLRAGDSAPLPVTESGKTARDSPTAAATAAMHAESASTALDGQVLTEQLTGVSQGASAAPMPATPEVVSGPAKIEAWLASSTDIPTIANNILAGFPSLKDEDQLLAASKLAALVSDDRFDALKRLLIDPKTTTEAKEFLFRDALSRADSLKLPLLLAIMQMPQHPCAAEARETLKTQFGADYGVNYGQWQAKIGEVLRAQQ